MTKIVRGRYTTASTDELVVFLIGMRLNKPWKVHRWLPVARAMPKMLSYLASHPEKGLLGFRSYFLPSPIVVQYWRSFEDLERFARDADDPHLEPWRRYVRKVGTSGDVGIWHETFKISRGAYEAVYTNMPVFGLAQATSHVPVGTGGNSAAQRIGGARPE